MMVNDSIKIQVGFYGHYHFLEYDCAMHIYSV